MTEHVLGRAPSRWDMAFFELKASAFRLKRSVYEAYVARDVRRHGKAETMAHAPVLARISSPLWPQLQGRKDRALTAGKIHNLRRAIRSLDGIEIPAAASSVSGARSAAPRGAGASCRGANCARAA